MRLNKKTTLILLYLYRKNRESINSEIGRLYRKATKQNGLDHELDAIANRDKKTTLTFVQEVNNAGVLVSVYEDQKIVYQAECKDELEGFLMVACLKVFFKLCGKPTIRVKKDT